MQTTIEVCDGKISVSGPYSDSNNERWRSLGGKFSGGFWNLPDNETTRSVIAELFGAKSDEVEALVPLDKATGYNVLQIGGYVLAARRFRDSAVVMPDGVSLASGSFPKSGGSVKNPRVAASDDTVFRLRCRKSFAEARGLELAKAKAVTIEV